MPDTEIGAISIGISADVRQLRAALNEAKKLAEGFNMPQKTIRIRISAPTQASVTKAQNDVIAAIQKAQKFGVELTPTLKVAGTSIRTFRNTIQTELNATKPIAVKITADVDGKALREQIQNEIGTESIKVPLEWYWKNGPPPEGGTPGAPSGPSTPSGSPGTGSAGRTAGRTTAKTTGTTTRAKATGTTAKATGTTATPAAGTDPHICPICGVRLANPNLMGDHFTYKHGATPVPQQATAAGPVTAEAPASPIAAATASRVMTKTKPATAAERRANYFGAVAVGLMRGQATSIKHLLEAGGILTGQGDDLTVSAKGRSDFAKYIKEGQEDTLKAMQMAVQTFYKISQNPREPGRTAFSGRTLSMAGATPVRSREATDALRREIEEMAKKRHDEFANNPKVKAIKQAFATQGMAAFDQPGNPLGQAIAGAHAALTGGDPVAARALTVEALAMFAHLFPKELPKIFEQDPGRGRTGGAGPRTRGPRRLPGKLESINPVVETQGAAVGALFSALFQEGIPRTDALKSKDLKMAARVRKEPRLHMTEAGLVPAEDEEAISAPEMTLLSETRSHSEGLPGTMEFLKLVQSGMTPRDAARAAIKGITGRTTVPNDLLNKFLGGIPQERIQAAIAGRTTAAGAPIVKTPGPPKRYGSIGAAGSAMRILGEYAGGPSRPQSNYSHITPAGVRLPGLRGMGGPVNREAYIVGEKGPEVFVPDRSGTIIPNNQLEHREAGGAIHFRGSGGRYVAAGTAAGQAVMAGLASSIGGGSVQRVFVVNWPAGGGIGMAPAMGQAAGPFSAASLGKQFAQSLGQAAAKSPKGTKAAAGADVPLTPLEQAQQQARREDYITAERLGQKKLAADISAQLRSAPTRGVPTSLGEISAINLGGLSKVIERRRLAEEAVVRSNVALNSLGKAQEKLNTLQLKATKIPLTDPKAYAQAQAKVQAQSEAVDFLQKRYDLASDSAKELTKNVISGSDQMKIFAANTTGVVGGMVLFSTLLGAATTGISALQSFLGPVIERMTGFQNVAGRVTGALADQIRQSNGAADAATAQAEAVTGLSAKSATVIDPLLKQRAETEAGNKAIVDQIALYHTWQALQGQGIAGADKGLFQTTGGLFGTMLQGVPSTIEQLTNEFKTIAPPAKASKDIADQAALEADLPGLRGLRERAGVDAGTKAAQLADELGNVNKNLDFFNGQLEKGGSNMRLTNQANEDQYKAIEASGVPGAKDFANAMRSSSISITHFNGSIKDLTSFLQSYNAGAIAPDPDLIIKQLTDRIIPAQRALFRAESNFQRNMMIPGQFALQNLAQPTPGLGNISLGQGLLGKGDTAAKQTADKYTKIVGGAVQDVNNMIEQGHQALLDLVPQDQKAEFSALLDDITKTGQQISKIQLGITQEQTNLTLHEYNNQLRVANRSLRDARDLQAALHGATRDTLGGIEGQNAALQRQLQLIGFELQQRQINFQVAIAGFVAPGSTPEERAQRIKEAKIEADYAQRQLDLQKQLASNEFKAIHITADRNVEDLVHQVALLQEGREVTIHTAFASRALDILNKKQQLLVEKAGTYIEEGAKITSAAMQAAAEVATQTGKDFSYILKATANAWGIFGQQAAAIMQALVNTAPTKPHTAAWDKAHHGASGLMAMTMGETQFVAGEVDGEAVAILKNPRVRGLGGVGTSVTGGGVSFGDINVVIEGGSGNETDARRFAEQVAREVESILSRKMSLIGARSAFG